MSENEFSALIKQLCNKFCSSPTSNNRPLSNNSSRDCRRLYKKAFRVYFGCVGGPFQIDESYISARTKESCLSAVQRLYSYAYELRRCKKFREAQQLEQFIDDSSTLGLSEDTLTGVLTVLTMLAQPPHEEKIQFGLQRSKEELEEMLIIEKNTDTSTCLQYTNFSRAMFENVSFDHLSVSSMFQLPDLRVISMEPGKKLTNSRFFDSSSMLLRDRHELETNMSLFGILQGSRTWSLDIHLELPNDFMSSELTRVKYIKHSTATSDDEGIGMSDSRLSSPHQTSLSSDVSSLLSTDEFWAEVLRPVRPLYRAWEYASTEEAQTVERPYVSEVGGHVTGELWDGHQHLLHVMAPSLYGVLPQRQVTVSRVVTDIYYMLVGVPSETFTFDKERGVFELVAGTCVPGLTPPALQSFCTPHMHSGVHFCRLCSLVTRHQHGGDDSGVVYDCYFLALRDLLLGYQAAVLPVLKCTTLLDVDAVMKRPATQLRHLAILSKCSVYEVPQPLPRGLALLNYVYESAVWATEEERRVYLHLFLRSLIPYLRFIQKWIFHGECDDPYNEFMITVDDNYLHFRDERFWQQAYQLSDTSTVAPFISDLVHAVFDCGKTVNLMLTIAPQHYLFSKTRVLPQLTLTLSSRGLQHSEREARVYLDTMRRLAEQSKSNRIRADEQAEKDRQNLIRAVRETREAEERSKQAKVLEVRRAEAEKKRQALAELKQQMELDLERREADKQREAEEDAARIAEMQQREITQAAAAKAIEDAAKAEMIEKYRQLTEEAEARERRALWRVERHKLAGQRAELLQQEQEMWQQQMEAGQENDISRLVDVSVLDGQQASLVSIAGNHEQDALMRNPLDSTLPSDLPPPIFSDDLLPAWARQSPRETAETETSSVDLLGSPDDLPQWARERFETTLPFGDKVTVYDVSFADNLCDNDTDDGIDEETGETTTERRPAVVVKRPTQHPSDSVMSTLMKDVQITDSDRDSIVDSKVAAVVDNVGQSLVELSHATRSVSGYHISMETDSNADVQGKRMVNGRHVSAQSAEQSDDAVPRIRLVDGQHASVESSESDVSSRGYKKVVDGQHVSAQSQEQVTNAPHVRQVEGKHASVETTDTEVVAAKGKRFIDGQHISSESVDDLKATRSIQPVTGYHASVESSEATAEHVPKTKRTYGQQNASQQSSNEVSATFRRLKKAVVGGSVDRETGSHLWQEPLTLSRDFGIVSSRARLARKAATADDVDARGIISHPSAETGGEGPTEDELRLKKFRERNTRGHSSSSTVQKLLYGSGGHRGNKDAGAMSATLLQMLVISSCSDYSELLLPDVTVAVDKLQLDTRDSDGGGGSHVTTDDDGAGDLYSLPVILHKALLAPLNAQFSIVSNSVVEYFMDELRINQHFEALRSFLIMYDGEFAQTLSEQLFDKMFNLTHQQELLNPFVLSDILHKAVVASHSHHSQLSSNLSLAILHWSDNLNIGALESLDCLGLTYKVSWPLNIVITEESLAKYGRLFSFLLKMKRVVWAFQNIWKRLQMDAKLRGVYGSAQYRHMQLARHSMQQFFKVLQGYLTTQLMHISWHEFQQQLHDAVHSVDDLRTAHDSYLDSCLFKCLLSANAKPVMDIISQLCAIILQFHDQICLQSWTVAKGTATHPAYPAISDTINLFNKLSAFLYQVLKRLVAKNYQRHLHELLLRLNFNNYYGDDL